MRTSQLRFDFSSKVLLITGAAGAIGAETARVFHRAGCLVALADFNEDGVGALADELDPTGATVCSIRYDAADQEDGASAVERTIDAFGAIDYLVPGAGIYLESDFAAITDNDWERTLAINLGGVFRICRAGVGAMRAGGAIVHIASIAGHRGSFRHAHYSATKGGIMALTRSMARELSPGLRVNAVSPGVIATAMTRHLMAASGDTLLNETPLGRFGESSEVAEVIAFLCSDGASFINGEIVHINGGLYMD